jgi:hypothetical protein
MNLKGITDEERRRKMNENQFCGFESTDGFVYACDPGCCKNPCPGQCAGAKSRPPEGTYVNTTITQDQTPPRSYHPICCCSRLDLYTLSTGLKKHRPSNVESRYGASDDL